MTSARSARTRAASARRRARPPPPRPGPTAPPRPRPSERPPPPPWASLRRARRPRLASPAASGRATRLAPPLPPKPEPVAKHPHRPRRAPLRPTALPERARWPQTPPSSPRPPRPGPCALRPASRLEMAPSWAALIATARASGSQACSAETGTAPQEVRRRAAQAQPGAHTRLQRRLRELAWPNAGWFGLWRQSLWLPGTASGCACALTYVAHPCCVDF
jgi:hypothetical protein